MIEIERIVFGSTNPARRSMAAGNFSPPRTDCSDASRVRLVPGTDATGMDDAPNRSSARRCMALKGSAMKPFHVASSPIVLATACVLMFAVSASAGPRQSSAVDRAEALRVFTHRVEEYAALHRRLEGPLPRLTPTTEMVNIDVARQLLANAIRNARPGAQQGGIFDSQVAGAFRAIIAQALRGQDVEAFLVALHEEHPDMHGVRAVVNEPLPEGTTHEVPCVLLQVLPVLPEDVQYRIVDHDLVLWDVHAGLVIDFVPNAFTREETRADRHR